jgi:hypothetical protein
MSVEETDLLASSLFYCQKKQIILKSAKAALVLVDTAPEPT